MNEGNVESTTGNVAGKTTHNRVGGIVGYAGTNTYVVACGNIGKVTYATTANNNHVGGIVGQLHHAYPQVDSSVSGKVYGSWTKDVNEVTLNTGSTKDGVGSLCENSEGQVNTTKVYKGASVITTMDELNTAITNNYNLGKSTTDVDYCSWTWDHTPGSWPTLK